MIETNDWGQGDRRTQTSCPGPLVPLGNVLGINQVFVLGCCVML